MVAPTLRRWLKAGIRSALHAQGIPETAALSSFSGRLEVQSLKDATTLVQSIFALFAVDPAYAWESAVPASRVARMQSGLAYPDCMYDPRYTVSGDDDSLPGLLYLLSSLKPGPLTDGLRDGLTPAIQSIQSRILSLDFDSTLHLSIKRSLYSTT